MSKKKICALFISLFIVGNNGMIAYATSASSIQSQINSNNQKINDLKDKKKEVTFEKETQKDQLEEIQGQLDSKNAELANTQIKIDSFESKIRGLEETISEIQSKVDLIDNEIKSTEDKIVKKEEEEKEKKELLGKRIRTAYKNSIGEQFIAIILGSQDVNDFVSKISNVAKIIEKDNELINEVKEIEKELSENKKKLNEKKNILDSQKRDIIEKQNDLKLSQSQLIEEKNKYKNEVSELQSLENKKTAIINSLTAKEKELQNQIGDLASYNDELQKQMDSLFNQINKNQSSGSGNSQTNTNNQGFIKPSSGPVTCPFGPRIHPITKQQGFHTGIDYGAPYGAPIKASKSGVVVRREFNTAFGNMIIIDHGGGVQTMYAHTSSYAVSLGEKVTQGQVIAYVGSTGWSTGPHLHFEIRINGQAVNPADYVK